MAHYDALVAQWKLLTSQTTDAKLAEINALKVPGPTKLVAIIDVMNYLRSAGAWLTIKAAAGTNLGALAAVDLNSDPRAVTMDFDLPIVGQMIGALVSANLLSAQQAADLVAMKNPLVPWWKANGYSGEFNSNDITAAGLS